MAESLNEIDYLTAKSILQRELSEHNLIKNGQLTCPELVRDKGETRIEFPAPGLNRSSLYECLLIIKNHIEYFRIHSIDSNFLTLQALNNNLFDTQNITKNIKFRFLFYSGSTKVEISKQSNYLESEILAILELFQYVFREDQKSEINPKEILNRLGIEVFDPLEAEIKGKIIDFDHIFGYESVKNEILETIVMPLKNPDIFNQVTNLTRKFPTNNRPRAILFEGEPGVGKTTMAKAVACLCKIPLVYVPIESIMSKYYGESAKNLSMIFDCAQLFPEALIFLDEIDSLAGKREDGMFEATKTMLSVLLRKLDGFGGKPGSITLGATNRKQDLDSALLSRFDKSIYFPLPNLEEVSAILSGYAIHLNDSERNQISALLPEYSGRKIKDFCDYVERKWATGLIEKSLPPSPPPLKLYLDVAEKEKNGF
ncbi:MAG: ATP-binding protein [Leptospira sp.]|nr:ATP-binding protein [Leptospira sp.]